MARIVIFDPNSTPNVILQVLDSASSPDYQGRSDVLVDPNLSAVQSVLRKYWKHSGGAVVAMTAQEQAAFDAAQAAALTASVRAAGKAIIDGTSGDGIIQRAAAAVMVDEINIMRQLWMSFKGQVALATNMATLQTRVAALPDTPDRTLSQFKTAIQNKIDAGTVDA